MNELETVKTLKNIERHLKNISISSRIVEERNREYSDLSPISIRKLKQHYDFSGMEISIELDEPVYIDHDAWWNRNYSRMSLFDEEHDEGNENTSNRLSNVNKDEDRIFLQTPPHKGSLSRWKSYLYENWEDVLLNIFLMVILVGVMIIFICFAITKLTCNSNTTTVSQQPIQIKILPPSR